MAKKEKKIEFNPRMSGKTIKCLQWFYGECKRKQAVVFSMPEGSIYSPKALANLLQQERKKIMKELNEYVPEEKCCEVCDMVTNEATGTPLPLNSPKED